MKKKICIYFKSDKFIRTFYFSLLKKKIEKKYKVTYLIHQNSKFEKNLRNKIIIESNFSLNNFFFDPFIFFNYFIFKVLDIISLFNLNFKSISSRFNIINKLGFQNLKAKYPNHIFDINAEEKAGNFLKRIHGFPFEKNQLIFNFFKNIYFSKKFISPSLNKYIEKEKPDLVFLTDVQGAESYELIKISEKKNIKLLASIYGWDRPTLKGYIPKLNNLNYIVNSQQMKREVIRFHNIAPKNVRNFGNYYLEFLRNIKIKKKSKYFTIFYALSTNRININELQTIEKIISFFSKKIKNVKFIIRTHPHDKFYKKKIRSLFKSSNIEITYSSFKDIKVLIKSLKNSNLVLTAGTSMTLDAMALNVPTANISLFKDDINFKKQYFLNLKKNNLIFYSLDKLYINLKNKKLSINNKKAKKLLIDPVKGVTKRYIEEIEKLL